MAQPPPPPPARPSPHGTPQNEEEEEEEEGGGAPGSPRGARDKGAVYRPGSRRCRRCLITFPDAAFAARHAKRQHPRDFAAAALRGSLFVCFVCARPFASSPALLRHQRGHAHFPPASGGKAAPLPVNKQLPVQTTPFPGKLPVVAAPIPIKQRVPGQAAPPSAELPVLATPIPVKRQVPAEATPLPAKRPLPLPATPPLACTECGRAFAREGALHRHYIRHARGEL